MGDVIRLLPDHVANQIAAGEVVQRPASVVKELLENAIDAGATRISLIVKEAGKAHIQVVDNGKGMSETDARMCFERHATSKIKKADDLFNLNTKGFRGEAMASIAAVAQVQLITKTSHDELGVCIDIEGSAVTKQQRATAAVGTSVTVKNLFFNIPARRNFLKSPQVEFRHVTDEFHRVALIHHDIHFELLHNGSEVFQLPPTTSRQRIVHVFGSKFDERLVPVSEKTALVGVNGFVLKPSFAKKSRHQQFFFVNGRFIKSGFLHHAVMAAFEGLLSPNHQPGYFIFLRVPNDQIDINIHPTKTEVKFEDEHALYAVLRAAVKHSLGQFSIAPVLDFSKDKTLDTSYTQYKSAPISPRVSIDASFNPFAASSGSIKPTKKVVFDDDFFDSSAKPLLETNPTSISFSFQWAKKYLIAPHENGILIIHQRRAHERVLYEEYMRSWETNLVGTQAMAVPLRLTLDNPSITTLTTHKDLLIEMGFGIEQIEGDFIAFNAIPEVFTADEIPSFINQWLTQTTNGTVHAFSQRDVMARTLAGQRSIPTGRVLETHEQIELIHKLFLCKEPDRSLSGNATFRILAANELERFFRP
ncbi:MAG: DNA mismatch repair endonuclease MutL [Flavobacteriaceae bacterium]|nr:DNA mismatch repair endonuclease MutL [Flavobacteriaceae bacterium]